MMFPYPSAYTFMLDSLYPRPRHRTPWDEVPSTSPDYGPNAGTKPWDVGGSAVAGGRVPGRRSAAGAGLVALGTSLLEGAGRGDWAGSLARGAQGFAEAYGGERDRARQEERQRQQEEMQQRQEQRADAQEQDRKRAAELNYGRDTAEFDAWKEQQARGKDLRTKTGKSAEVMLSEINSLAAANPKNQKLQVMARRAAGYALGEDSDLNKLAALHDEMTGQAFKQQDFDQETEMGIGRARQEIAADVRSDPKAAERRANEELEISRGHLAVAQENAGRVKEGMTDLQAYDRLEKKVQAKVDARTKAYYDSAGRYPSQDTIDKWHAEAVTESMQELQGGMNSVYNFTRDGRFVPQRVN